MIRRFSSRPTAVATPFLHGFRSLFWYSWYGQHFRLAYIRRLRVHLLNLLENVQCAYFILSYVRCLSIPCPAFLAPFLCCMFCGIYLVPLIPLTRRSCSFGDRVGLQCLARCFLGSVLLDDIVQTDTETTPVCFKPEWAFLQWLSKLILLFQNLKKNILGTARSHGVIYMQ
jgi:hypothetical protein